MKKAEVVKIFSDKENNLKTYSIGEKITLSDSRFDKLMAMGYVKSYKESKEEKEVEEK